jgi:hypothetical protein
VVAQPCSPPAPRLAHQNDTPAGSQFFWVIQLNIQLNTIGTAFNLRADTTTARCHDEHFWAKYLAENCTRSYIPGCRVQHSCGVAQAFHGYSSYYEYCTLPLGLEPRSLHSLLIDQNRGLNLSVVAGIASIDFLDLSRGTWACLSINNNLSVLLLFCEYVNPIRVFSRPNGNIGTRRAAASIWMLQVSIHVCPLRHRLSARASLLLGSFDFELSATRQDFELSCHFATRQDCCHFVSARKSRCGDS